MRVDTLDAMPVTKSVCGGAVVDEKRKLVATAWHCVPNQRSIVEKSGIFSVGGMNAKLLTFSPEADIAIIEVDDLKGMKAPQFKTPNKGDLLTASAYYDAFIVQTPTSTSDRFVPQMSVQVTLDWEGRVAAVANANRLSGEHFNITTPTEFKWVIVTGNPAPGFSGGPVFDRAGNFAGIISSGNGGFTNVSSSENITMIIRSIK
jgi:S1-C subfamily serine protease